MNFSLKIGYNKFYDSSNINHLNILAICLHMHISTAHFYLVMAFLIISFFKTTSLPAMAMWAKFAYMFYRMQH